MSEGKYLPSYFPAYSPSHPCFLSHTFLGAGLVHSGAALIAALRAVASKEPKASFKPNCPQAPATCGLREENKLEFGVEGKEDASILNL